MALAAIGANMLIRFLPSGIEIEIVPGTTLLDAAQQAGLPVGNSCGADGTCGRCGLRAVSGSLPPRSPREQRVLLANRVDTELRLSCMVQPVEDVEITADYW